MDGKPVCACGSKLTRLSDRMLLVWADHEGERWGGQHWNINLEVNVRHANFLFCEKGGTPITDLTVDYIKFIDYRL